MKNLISFTLAMFLVVGMASAQNPHINKKDVPGLVCTSSPELVCFSGVVAGNGNASSVTAYLIVDVECDTYCFNPAGGAKDDIGVPGHQGFTFQGEEQTFDCRNGKANLQNVCAALNIDPGCPNAQWEGVIENLQVNSVILMINGKALDVTGYYL